MTIKKFEDIGQKILRKSNSLGVSGAEAFITHNKELTIEVSDQKVETLKLADQQGLGVRVFKNGRLGFAYTSDLSDAALDDVVRQAAANSDSTAEDEFNRLPNPVSAYPEVAVFDPMINRTPVEEKIELAKEIESIARSYDPRVKITERCAYVDSVYEVTIINSSGVQGSYQGSYCGAYALLVAEDKAESQTGFAFQYKLNFNEIDPGYVAAEGAKKAVRMLGAKAINTQQMTAVFDPYVATSFLGMLSSSLYAESVQKGKSRLAGKIGQKVASKLITVIDNGRKPGAIMSSPFDGEGVPSQKTILVDQGVLKSFLYNSYTAAKDGQKSTGNGARSSYTGTPETGTTNFYLENGTIPKDEMIKEIAKGLYITDVMGMHTANPISGDFSLGASGILIENGELTTPVRGVAIAGNVFDLIRAVDGIASDLTFFVGKGSPTLRVTGMTVSGS